MNSSIISLHSLSFLIIILSVVNSCVCEISKKNNIDEENREDNGEGNDDAKEESMSLPVENESTNLTCTRRQNSQMHEIRPAHHKQFPFVAALMSHQNEFLCSGSVVSNGIILTSAKCTQLPVSYILLNTTNDKRDEGAAMVHVVKTEKFPSYTGSDSLKDVGLIYTQKCNSSMASKISISNYTSARNLVDIEGIGFGLNVEINQPRVLQYVGMEVRTQSEDILSAFFDCVETKVPICYKDKGGPVIFENELIGIVINGQEDCLKQVSSTYAINKKMVDVIPTYTFKAWLDEKITKNEEQEQTPELPTYPSKPVALLSSAVSSASAVDSANPVLLLIVLCYFLAIYSF